MPSSSDDVSSSSSSESDGGPPLTKKNKAESVSDASSSDSDSNSSDEKDKKKKKKPEKKEKKKKKGKKAKKADKKGKKKGKKAGKKGKGKKDKKKKKAAKAKRDSVSNQFGKYGVIKGEDFFSKKAEFLAWASEVRKENTDALGQMQLKDLFKEYIEDYNTATMPSKKYYNLNVWDAQQQRKRHKQHRTDDMTDAQRAALASFDDERARKEELKNIQMKKQESMITDEVRRLRQNKDKVADMRNQAHLATHRDQLLKSGNEQEAAKVAQKLGR